MSTLSFEQETQPVSYPPLVVFGAGNSEKGLSLESRQQAEFAANLLSSGSVPSNMAITLGYGPFLDIAYPESESAAMQRQIEENYYGDKPVKVISESDLLAEEIGLRPSYNTLTNLRNLTIITRHLEIENVALIARKSHIGRVGKLGELVLPKSLSMQTVASDELEATFKEKLINKVSVQLAKSIFKDIDPLDINSINQGIVLYDSLLSGAKKRVTKGMATYGN